jgi:hypothetical protein
VKRQGRIKQRASRLEVGFPRWLGPAGIAISLLALTWWSWGKWSDPQVDFGLEVYIPWQLSAGKALYRDIAYRNGPLSQYVNTLWFLLFGVSIRTLVLCNLAILAGICVMVYRLFTDSFGRLTATTVCLVFLSVFSFSQYVGFAGYNYVTPYQHYQTHGLALSIGMIAALGKYLRKRSFSFQPSRQPAWESCWQRCLNHFTLLAWLDSSSSSGQAVCSP